MYNVGNSTVQTLSLYQYYTYTPWHTLKDGSQDKVCIYTPMHTYHAHLTLSPKVPKGEEKVRQFNPINVD